MVVHVYLSTKTKNRKRKRNSLQWTVQWIRCYHFRQTRDRHVAMFSSFHAAHGVETNANYSGFRSKCLSIWCQSCNPVTRSPDEIVYARESRFDTFVLRVMQMRNFVYRRCSLDGSINLQDYFSPPNEFVEVLQGSSRPKVTNHRTYSDIWRARWFARSSIQVLICISVKLGLDGD